MKNVSEPKASVRMVRKMPKCFSAAVFVAALLAPSILAAAAGGGPTWRTEVELSAAVVGALAKGPEALAALCLADRGIWKDAFVAAGATGDGPDGLEQMSAKAIESCRGNAQRTFEASDVQGATTWAAGGRRTLRRSEGAAGQIHFYSLMVVGRPAGVDGREGDGPLFIMKLDAIKHPAGWALTKMRPAAMGSSSDLEKAVASRYVEAGAPDVAPPSEWDRTRDEMAKMLGGIMSAEQGFAARWGQFALFRPQGGGDWAPAGFESIGFRPASGRSKSHYCVASVAVLATPIVSVQDALARCKVQTRFGTTGTQPGPLDAISAAAGRVDIVALGIAQHAGEWMILALDDESAAPRVLAASPGLAR